jgi:type IV pilus assembly protein PilY1
MLTTTNGGVLIYFGTGSYLTTDDLTDDQTQTFYAVWDKPEVNGTVTRSQLQVQTLVTETTFEGHEVRTTSKNPVDWDSKRGWYLDLKESTNGVPSERIVSTPVVMEFDDPDVPDRVLFVTNTPSPDPCSHGGTTWLMELDLVTGARTDTSVFDFNNDNAFDQNDTLDTDNDGTGDTPVTGVALPVTYGITGEPLLLKTESGDIVKEFSGSTGVSGTAGGPLQRGGGGGGSPAPPVRIYWQQIQ